ncbi:eukaryotic translation initiation factor 4 gamma 1-like isoform X2 [Limulus polyphemus]|uniref:Eukaryotic translation initiation factor 4 gamma 1-like isoform X2 n=1 Tax=Limulus polyphemus TaxID=6850 RepID=A0ABM1S7T3_LIMPO|nr:eukaryotic translation initiation factor 4 gamma 1-like isoform X2 [Limulus polyphemus]
MCISRPSLYLCSRSQQYTTAPQYSMSPTQQTMYMTPASQPYSYNQQPQQQVYYPVGPPNMAAVPRTMPHMVHSGSGTTEKREKKILAVVDPVTGQDIMPEIISHSCLKESTTQTNVVAAQFASQVAALVTAPKENTPPKAETERSEKTQMPKVLPPVNSSNGLKTIPAVIESKTTLTDINSECDIRVPVHCHTEVANVIANGVTAVILEPESVVVLHKLNENCVPETNFSSIVHTSKNSIKVSQEQPNENNRIADEVDKEVVNISEVINSCPSLLEKDNIQVSVSVEDDYPALQEEPTSTSGPTDIESNENHVEQQVKKEVVVEVKQISDLEFQKESLKHNGEVTKHDLPEVGRVVKEFKKPRGQKRMKELNKKGESKEGGDMDAFLDKEQTSTPLSLSPKPDIVLVESSFEPSVIPIRPLQDELSEEQRLVLENNQANRRVSQEVQDVGGAKVHRRNLLEEQVVEKNQTNLRVLQDQVTEKNLVKMRVSQEEETPDTNQANKTLPSKDQVIEKNQTSESLLEEEEEIVENISMVKELHLQESYITLKYDYSANQWSPLNQEGKKQYDRAFLLQLQSEPMSLKKPQGLPNLEVIKDKANLSKQVDMRRTVNMNQFRNYHSDNLFLPLYTGIQQRNGQGGGAGRRQSQHNRDKGKKITSSFSKDVKLHESENAWKPSYKAPEPESPEEKKTRELYKKVQGILNKLTPQKFKTLVSQVKELPIDNEERLKGVINLVFKKAIEEPSFSVPYANMCKTLAVMQVPAAEGSNECVKFSKILLTKCQHEFEKDIYDEIQKEERLKEIEEAELEEKKGSLTGRARRRREEG